MTLCTNGGNGSKLLLGLLHLILVVITGWALKYQSNGQYSMVAYALLFAHSILSILCYAHPNAGYVQRSISEQLMVFVPLLFSSLIITQLLFNLNDLGLCWIVGSILIYTYKVLSVICRKRHQRHDKLLGNNICVLWNLAFLAHIVYMHEACYWTAGLAILLFLNQFIFWRLTLHFSISRLEITTVGLCFLVFFALNTVSEIIDLSSS